MATIPDLAENVANATLPADVISRLCRYRMRGEQINVAVAPYHGNHIIDHEVQGEIPCYNMNAAKASLAAILIKQQPAKTGRLEASGL